MIIWINGEPCYDQEPVQAHIMDLEKQLSARQKEPAKGETMSLDYPENLPEISIDPERASHKEIAMMAADLMDRNRDLIACQKELAEAKSAHAELFSDFTLRGRTIESLRGQLAEKEKETKDVKHVLFELVIAPNCPTCSNQMTGLCDNGIICMSKVMNAEFIRYDILKRDVEIARLKQAITKTLEENGHLADGEE